VRRHRRARDATRAGLPALGFRLYVTADGEAASVATLAMVPPAAGRAEPVRLLEAAVSSDGEDADDSGLIAGPAFGSLADRAIRLNHTGPNAALAPVLATLAYLGSALSAAGQDADVGAALAAAAARWQASG
jgi:aspartate aminotransferase-like enzyme